ncbi:MAG TPA: NAD(+) diphosphatase [Solirubrobacteraceae bacterium]|nr:NAD(+) diphosphatase [Solirubrobacteraceae bacterium]
MPEPITFAGGALDRAADRRTDEAWIAAARNDPRARAVVVGPGGVALAGETPELASLDGLNAADGYFLGLADGIPLFVVPATTGAQLTGLREAAAILSQADAGLVAYASALAHWHDTHRFCGVCGERTEAHEGGHSRRCPNGHVHHPRTDPVVIMLVSDGDRLLLGRRPPWPPGRYSCLAGFVEPGESLEAAVAREVLEEAAVVVGAVEYRLSQPWPFPLSLMLGFEATYASGRARVADAELEDVAWFTRDEILAGTPLLPPPFTIARRLIDGWLEGGRAAAAN